MTLNIGTIDIPLGGATKTFAILAKRGAGKSYAANVMAEELFKNNIPFVVFDPIDVWWGLRFKKDGKSKGLPIVVFGQENADIQFKLDKRGKLEEGLGKRIAQAIVKHNISCIINTFGVNKNSQRQLITDFAEELLRINNTPRHIFIEEAHEFVPQRVFGEMGRTFNAVSNLVVMGRNRGLGVTLINQRPATINKDVLTQIDNLIVLRVIAPQDIDAVKAWLEYHAEGKDITGFIKSLPNLPTGEAWIWSPEFMGIFQKIKIRERETFHPDREKLGTSFEMPNLEQIDVQTFISEFNKQIAPRSGVMEAHGPHKPEASTFNSSERDMFTNRINQLETQLIQKQIEIRRLQGIVDSIKNIVGFSGPMQTESNISINTGSIQLWSEKLGNSGASRIFKFLADKSPMKFTRSQIGLAVGLSSSSGSFATYISTLKRNKLIIEEGGFARLNPDL